MAQIKIRAASLYVGGSKIAECEGTTYDLDGGDEAMFGDPGYLGHSEGAITSKLSAKTIVPVKGMKVSLLDALLKKKVVDVALGIVDGKIHRIQMRVTNASIASAHRNGTQTGDFTFQGGEPEVTG